MVQIKDILQWIDSRAPFRFAESWDNCGLQVGNPGSMVTKVLVALDPGSGVLKEAGELGCECLITHHPLLLRPIQNIRTDSWPGSIIAYSLSHGVNIIAAHTNLDAAHGGTNAQLVGLLGLSATEPLDAEANFEGDQHYLGIGLAGSLPGAMTVDSLVARLSGALGGGIIRITGDRQKKLSRAAVCTGSGASLIGKVLAAGADVFITGDMKYHDARLAEESGLVVIDIGHFASETLVLEPLAAFMRSEAQARGAALEVFVSKSEKDPFQVIA